MSNLTRAMMMGAAGASGDKTYVDDVFSTYVYDGTSGSNPINNGIDLAGEGGMVWFKSRDYDSGLNPIHDTERSAGGQRLSTSSSGEQYAYSPFASINNNGFTLTGSGSAYNNSSYNYVSWTFRKAPGFFDVVTYTGDTDAQLIPHSLGSVPGMIIVKCTNTGSTNWLVYHTSLGPTKAELLDLTTGPAGPSANYWNNTAPTSTHFTVGSSNDVNTDGDTYVAYLFANDEPVFGTDEDESIIKCGSLTTNSSGTLDAPIDLGFEPQFILTKNQGGQWYIFDTMRGVGAVNTTSNTIKPNSSGVEQNRVAGSFAITSTGFTIPIFGLFSASVTVPYMAIRFPNKPPTAATEVFVPSANQIDTQIASVAPNFPVDVLLALTTTQYNNHLMSRLTRNNFLRTNSVAAEISTGVDNWDYMDNVLGPSQAGQRTIYNMFKRAPGFMDVVAYKGFINVSNPSGSISHNLKVTPELAICRNRDTTNRDWIMWHKDLAAGDYLFFNTGGEAAFGTNWFVPSSTQITYEEPVSGYHYVAVEGYDYINYLFATLPGISKVGSYSGDTGNAVDVDCGFTTGARFILIKRKNGTGDWYSWNSSSGIVSGNDPYVLLNSALPEVTDTDYIDPLNAGFTVTSSAPAALNETGGTYIFLAVA